MKAPKFWTYPHDKPGLRARLLQPLGALYAQATARRVGRNARYHAPVPVICVGNINAGGVGKTPTVIALTQHLQELGKRVHIVSKGYGGQTTSPLQVETSTHSADQVGDEPLLLAAFAPTWVGADRAATAQHAVNAGADIILLDDGHQDPALHKDKTLVIVDAVTGFGNGRCIPAGPLREPVAAGLARADLLLSIGPKPAQSEFKRQWGTLITIPHTTAQLAPLRTGMDWQGLRCLAFAGIGRPGKFFDTLRGLGAEILHEVSLDDHQPLTTSLMARLDQDAKLTNAQLVTTEKDAVRLPDNFRQKVLTLPVRLQFGDIDQITQILGGKHL